MARQPSAAIVHLGGRQVPGVALLGARPMVAVLKQAVPVSARKALLNGGAQGTPVSVELPSGTFDAVSSVERSSDISCFMFTGAWSVGTVLYDPYLQHGDRLTAAEHVEFQVCGTAGRHVELRALDAIANRQALVGEPVYRVADSNSDVVGMITKVSPEGWLQMLRPRDLRRSAPSLPHGKGTPLYEFRRALQQPVYAMHLDIKQQGFSGITDASCDSIKAVFAALSAFYTALAGLDGFAGPLAASAKTMAARYAEWNDVGRGPRGQNERNALHARIDAEKMKAFGEIRHVAPDAFKTALDAHRDAVARALSSYVIEAAA